MTAKYERPFKQGGCAAPLVRCASKRYSYGILEVYKVPEEIQVTNDEWKFDTIGKWASDPSPLKSIFVAAAPEIQATKISSIKTLSTGKGKAARGCMLKVDITGTTQKAMEATYNGHGEVPYGMTTSFGLFMSTSRKLVMRCGAGACACLGHAQMIMCISDKVVVMVMDIHEMVAEPSMKLSNIDLKHSEVFEKQAFNKKNWPVAILNTGDQLWIPAGKSYVVVRGNETDEWVQVATMPWLTKACEANLEPLLYYKKTESKKQKIGDRLPNAKDQRTTTNDRRPKTEGQRPKAHN